VVHGRIDNRLVAVQLETGRGTNSHCLYKLSDITSAASDDDIMNSYMSNKSIDITVPSIQCIEGAMSYENTSLTPMRV